MDVTIHSSYLPHLDPEASLAFYRDALGFDVRLDVGDEGMRWITVGPIGQPDTAIVLHPVDAARELTDDDRALLGDLVAKGSFFGVNLATADLDATFARLEAAGVDVAQEPIAQDYGVRDAAVRDPAGTMIRIQETRTDR